MLKKISESIVLLILAAVLVYLVRNQLVVYYHNRGISLYEQGQYLKAARMLEKSLTLSPSLAVVHYHLARVYKSDSLESKAIVEYQKAIQLDPTYVKPYIALANIYSQNKDYDAALGVISGFKNKGQVNDEVKELFSRLSLEYALSCLKKGTDDFLAGNKEKAYRFIKKAIKIRPDLTQSYYVSGYLYYLDRDLKQAEIELREAIRLEPRFWLAHKLLGDIYLEKKEFRKAIESYKTAANFTSEDFYLYNNLGLACMEIELYDEAAAYLKQALSLKPNNINTLYSLASVHRDGNHLEEAKREYLQLIALKPDYQNVHNDLGDIVKQQGGLGEAKDEYQKELEYDLNKLQVNPDDPIILNSLAYAYYGLGNYPKAEEIALKAIRLKPDYRQALITLARIQEITGRYAASLESLEKVKSLSREAAFIEREQFRVREKQFTN